MQQAGPNEIEAIYRVNPILSYTVNHLKASLLALPYGEVMSHSEFSRIDQLERFVSDMIFGVEAKSRGYGTLQEEALRIFNSLQDQESLGNPIPVIQVWMKGLACKWVLTDFVACVTV